MRSSSQPLQVARNELAATSRRVGRHASASSLQPRAVGPFFLFSVLQLGTQVARSDYRPPFTLGIVVAQTLSYLRPGWLKIFLRVGRPVSGQRVQFASWCCAPTLAPPSYLQLSGTLADFGCLHDASCHCREQEPTHSSPSHVPINRCTRGSLSSVLQVRTTELHTASLEVGRSWLTRMHFALASCATWLWQGTQLEVRLGP